MLISYSKARCVDESLSVMFASRAADAMAHIRGICLLSRPVSLDWRVGHVEGLK
jgi:hypothetical protein